MANIIKCDCNAGMERFFLSKTASGDTNISRDVKYYVFFDIFDPNTPAERRQLRVVDIETEEEIMKINLNDNGGLKPLKGLTKQYKPTVKPNPKYDQACEIEVERVFYAEINLSADADVEVFLVIVPLTLRRDRRRYLLFKGPAGILPLE